MLRGTDVGSATLIPGKFLVNVFPSRAFLHIASPISDVVSNHLAITVLKVPSWFPGTAWQKTGRKYRQLMLDMVQVPYNRVKEAEVRFFGSRLTCKILIANFHPRRKRAMLSSLSLLA